jgi:RNA polymerase sigma-70 factor (ECF subfamily)
MPKKNVAAGYPCRIGTPDGIPNALQDIPPDPQIQRFFVNHFFLYSHPMSEKELVQRAQAGDFGAFSELIGAHKSRIYGLALKLSGNAEDAEDILQDTFLKAIDKIDQFRLESSFGTWLYAIALNEARALFNKRKQTDLKPIEDYLPSGGHVVETGASGNDSSAAGPRLLDWKDPEKLFESDELRQTLDRLIAELPYIYREAFVLRYIEELSVKEVAKQIGESEAATKSRILRARLALREQLSEVFEERYERKMS